jgi:hypothetical protein
MTSVLPTKGLGQAATCSRTGPPRIPRTLTGRCVLLRSVKPTPVSKHTLTIRTFLFSPLSLAHPTACTASFWDFFFYRPTGRPKRTSLPVECHRNAINRNHFGSSAAFYQGLKSKVGLAAVKAAALRINLNVQGCSIVAASMHAPSSNFPSPPPPSFTQSPSPPRSLVRDGQTSPHRPRIVVSRSTCPPISPPPTQTALYYVLQ